MGNAKRRRAGLRETARWTVLGSLGGLAAVVAEQRREQLLPWVKKLLGEAAAFQEWLTTGAAQLREEGEDLWAEARQAARDQAAARLTLEQTEAELRARLEQLEQEAPRG